MRIFTRHAAVLLFKQSTRGIDNMIWSSDEGEYSVTADNAKSAKAAREHFDIEMDASEEMNVKPAIFI